MCVYGKEVPYLGHIIDAEGLHTAPSKTEAIVQALPPKKTQELRSFLGMLSYYGRLIPNLSTILHPLNRLLGSETKWNWSRDCEEAFQLAKTHCSHQGCWYTIIHSIQSL